MSSSLPACSRKVASSKAEPRRQRSGSRWVSKRRQHPTKAAIRKWNGDARDLRVGDAVRIFSLSASSWVHGEVIQIMGNRLCVEYEVGDNLCRKEMDLLSEHITAPLQFTAPPSESCGTRSKLVWPDCNFVDSACSDSFQDQDDQCAFSEVDPEAPQGMMPDPQTIGKLEDYSNIATIWQLLEEEDVVLIKGEWLRIMHMRSQYGPVPCRQELPPQAFWSVQELKNMSCSRSLFGPSLTIVAISHCWLSLDHPDPTGSQMREIVRMLDIVASERSWVHQFQASDEHVAVFWAWCSLYQRRRHRPNGPLERLPKEEKAFTRGLHRMHLWYTHECIHTWCITRVPRGIPSFHERGWTTWELSISLLLTGVGGGDVDAKVLDISLLDGVPTDELGRRTYADVVATCQAVRQVPMTPEEFNGVIEQKNFTARNADLPVLKNTYKRAFLEIIGEAEFLDYRDLEWHDEEMVRFAKILPFCSRLKNLNLSGNCIGAGGVQALIDKIPLCRMLDAVYVARCRIDEDGMQKLSRVCKRCKKLEYLDITCNPSSTGSAARDIFRLGQSYANFTDAPSQVRRRTKLHVECDELEREMIYNGGLWR